MPFYFLDVVEESWLQRNSRDMTVLVIVALTAIAAVVGFIIWRKRNNKQS
jgi:LPXTG-motif cell wall-anchored protein